MQKNRLEAFSDGVIAIIITIMVLQLEIPLGTDLTALRPLLPVFLSYVLSFVYVGIYWNNHHHLVHAAQRVTAPIMWANLYFLFWQSLIPFVTGWMGENHFAAVPTATYGFVLLMAAMAYFILEQTILATQGPNSRLKQALGNNTKGKISLIAYAAAIGLAFVHVWAANALYVLVAIMWFIPDRRIERALRDRGE